MCNDDTEKKLFVTVNFKELFFMFNLRLRGYCMSPIPFNIWFKILFGVSVIAIKRMRAFLPSPNFHV